MISDLELLTRLVEAVGPSGGEDDVAALLGDALAAAGARTSRDPGGNLHATLGGDPGRGRVAVVAHLDEVGIVVRHVRADGFLLVDRVGGIGRRSLAARHIRLRGDAGLVDGVIGVRSHHLTAPAEYQTLPPIEDLYVDVGAGSAEDVARLGLRVGSRGTFAGSLLRLGRDILCGKALDDRALCYALVAVAREVVATRDRPEAVLIGTVREEFDFAGSTFLAANLNCSLAIVLDITPALDTPDADGCGVRLGGGPALMLQDFHGRGPLAGYIASPQLTAHVRNIAHAVGVALQEEVRTGVVTDAAVLAPALGPGRVACLSLPVRYTHSPVEAVRGDDLSELIRLVIALLSRDVPAAAP